MTGEAASRASRGDRWTGWCPHCRKESHESRTAARAAKRKVAHLGHMQAYLCPHNERVWHIGHLPKSVYNGKVEKRAYLTGKPFPVVLHVEEDAMAVTVTWDDPRDAAHCNTALLEQAVAEYRAGNSLRAKRYERMAEQLGKAIDHAPVPAVNDAQGMRQVGGS